MKKIFIFIAALLFVATAGTFGGRANAFAATAYPEDNYGAYILATGAISGGDGMTVYYTEIGDGNGVVTFDLLSANSAGWFGVVCGDGSKLGKLADIKDYALFGKDVKTTLDVGNIDFKFVSGNTYRATFNAKEKKISLDFKEIGADDATYVNVFTADATFASSNTVGLAAFSDGTASSTAIIDNLLISDLKGRSYVSNSFNGNATVKDGNMVTLCTNPETGAKLTSGVGTVALYKDLLCTVRFMSENGEIVSEQKVCLYGSATAPEVPEKEGYVFDGWSESLNGIRKNTVIYPKYKLAEEPEQSDSDSSPSGEASGNDTPGSAQNKGCGGVIAAPVWALGLFVAFVVLRKRRVM